MPIQTPQWTEFLTCPICFNQFEEPDRHPISLGCGHTMCKPCLLTLHMHKTQCPFDQASVSIDIDKLPVNTALLKLVGAQVSDENVPDIPCIQENKTKYLNSMRKIEELAMFLKSAGTTTNGNMAGASNSMNGITGLNRPMQRKLVNLVNCQLAEEEGRTRVMRAARSLGERTVTELMLLHQNPQQLSANLWAAVRNRGCQFLGPAMQEEALKLILLALEGGESLCRKVLVLFVVQKLESVFPQASKTSIGHVVQLLYRASCFVVTKRDDDSSLMQLKEQFRTYDALRREHDAQIVQIAMEAGLRISPEQWSSVLYGDSDHKSHMQSIIDKLQTPQSFSQSIVELIFALQRSNDPGELIKLRPHFELLSNIDASPEAKAPEWDELEEAMNAVHAVVSGLVNFSRVYGTKMKGTVDQPQPNHNHSKYKTSMCRDYQKPGGCPRGSSCSFAHSEEELEKFGRRKPVKGKGGIVARGPSSMSSDLSYSSMENGLDQTANTGSPQSQHMNGSARSSPCELAPVNSYGQPQTQYRRDQSMPQRIKQMNLHSPTGYSSPGPYDGRMSYPTNGESPNGYYYATNGFTPGMVPRDMKGVAGPPGIITPPSSSPLTIQEDINGSRENGLTNGHVENGMGRRLAHGRQFDPNPRRRAPGYVYETNYGGFDQYFPPSNGYQHYYRPPPFHDPYLSMASRPDGFGYEYVCQQPIYEPQRSDYRNFQTRRPCLPDERELQDSPRSLSDESEHLDYDFFRPRRKDTTMSNASSGVSSGSPLSRSPTASQASSSSLSPRQDSPVIWQNGGDGDKILQTYKWSTTNENNEVNKSIKDLWQQPFVGRPTFSRHDQDQISSDALFARHLQEEENKSLLETTGIDNGDSLLRSRRGLDEDRLKVRREQEENDHRIALEVQAYEEEDKIHRTKHESEHERLYKERVKLLVKQTKEQQELKDRRLARQIAFEDAKKSGLLPTRQIGYSSSLIPRGTSSCPYHGTRALGSIGSYRKGCSPLYGEDDVMDSPRHTCREDVITFTG